MPDNSKWRLFIAIELPAYARQKIRRHVDTLRRELPEARASWTREENLHLTLKFFGDTPVEKVEEMSQTLSVVANRMQPFEIELDGCGAFPPNGRPKVLWIAINDPSGNLRNLYEALEAAYATLGFAQDPRSFTPHLTIARLRNSGNTRSLAGLHQTTTFNPLSVPVKAICLIRSELNSEGSRYTTLAQHQLAGCVG